MGRLRRVGLGNLQFVVDNYNNLKLAQLFKGVDMVSFSVSDKVKTENVTINRSHIELQHKDVWLT